MGTILIGYDLDRPGQHYTNLIKAIEGLGAWWHHLDSTWIVKTDLPPTTVRDRLSKHIDSNDKLLVFDIQNKASAWVGFDAKGSQWLRDNT